MGTRDGQETITLPEDAAVRGVRPNANEKEAAPSDVQPGDCLGRYTVRALLGTGGMGQVFAAWDPGLGRTIALKVLRPDRAVQSSGAPARLVREAQALARSHHANVVTIHDIGIDGDRL